MAENNGQKMKEITERLEQGVEELFTSEKYTEYLKTMSQFHGYSFNNTLLIAMQKPDATLVAGYNVWKRKFNRHVKRGEKAIQIIAPVPVKEKQEMEKIDPETQEPILRPDGQPETEEVEVTIPRFKIASVFDYAQTDGDPLPGLEAPELMGSVENFEIFMKAIREVSPVPIQFAEISSEAKGYYSNTDKNIVIQEGMSERQTMKTAVHEVTHAMLHDRELMEKLGEKKDKMTREVEAESVAYSVCQYFGLDTSDYSFPYIAGWSSNREMKELRTSMDTIRRTAGEFIDKMTEEIRSLQREREKNIESDLVFQVALLGEESKRAYLVDNVGRVDFLRILQDFADRKGDVPPEPYLRDHGVHLYLWKDSGNLENDALFPDFYDVLYIDTEHIVDSERLSSLLQAEMMMSRAEYGQQPFNDEERNLVRKYTYKYDNPENTRRLIRELADARQEPDVGAVRAVMEHAQEEIDLLPDKKIGFMELHQYGFPGDSMLPVTMERAVELHHEGLDVYGLNKDGSRILMDTELEILERGGMFGVESGAWEKYRTMEGIRQEKEMEDLESDGEQYEEVELFGVPALFSNGRISRQDVPEGFYRYDLQGSDYDPGMPVTIGNGVAVNHAGSILMTVPLPLHKQGFLYLGEELNFIGGAVTAREFLEEHPQEGSGLLEETMMDAIIHENEDIPLNGDPFYDQYVIYQIKDDAGRDGYRFMGMDFVKSHGMEVRGEDYSLVYGGSLDSQDTLDDLFYKFNQNHPEGFTGHSLSVSDVIVMNRDGEAKAYYVDRLGFSELPDFIPQRLQMMKVEQEKRQIRELEVEGHFGTWHSIDLTEIEGEKFFLMESDEYGETLNIAVNEEGELVAEDLENGFDRGFHEALAEYFAGKGIAYKPDNLGHEGQADSDREAEAGEIAEKVQTEETEKEFPPVYLHSLSYAMEHGAADTYLDSRKLNFDCKKAIEDAIRNHFDGMHLNHEAAKGVLEAYGAERVAFLLANTVQHQKEDGRYSSENKSWADTIRIPENISRGMDLNADYILTSHPAVLDGFIGLAREDMPEIEKVSIKSFYVVNDAYGVKAEREYQYFPTLDAALTAYAILPNHLDKGIGMESTELPPSRMALISCRNGIETLEDLEFSSLSGKWVTEKTAEMSGRAKEYLDNHDTEIAFRIKRTGRFFFIQTVDGGYDYTFYNKDYQELDGGVYDNPDISIGEAIKTLLENNGLSLLDCEVTDCETFRENVQEAEQKAIQQKEKVQDQKTGKTALPLTSDRTEPMASLNGKDCAGIEETVLCYAQSMIDEMGLENEVKLLGARVYGSRSREGLSSEESDVDVVISYSGNIREDDFFNRLHEDELKIAGMEVDITPISTEKTGTLEDYLKQAEDYLDKKGTSQTEKRKEKAEPPKDEKISFYVAECMEFPVMGEYHENLTLQEAVRIYQSIPEGRKHGIKGIGFSIENGDPLFDSYGLMEAGMVTKDVINEIPYFKENPLVQKAIADMEAIVSSWEKKPKQEEKTTENLQPEIKKSVDQETPVLETEKKEEKIQETDNNQKAAEGTSKKQSVLKALRERQAKLQEKEKAGQKNQSRKKGEQEL